jgi:hypothetical protein
MAVNGIRVSALPEMIASDLTNDDYLIVNDANTNTRRINYEEFLKSVNTDISDLDVVQSVNGLSGVVSLDAADVGAPSLVQFQALETTSNAAGALAAANASAIVTLNTDTSNNTSDIATNTSGIATNKNDIATNTVAIANISNGTTNQVSPKINGVAVTATGAELNQLDGVTLGSAASADTGDFATAAQGIKADSAVQPGDIGTAAAKDVGDFATEAQGLLADSALQSDAIGVSVQGYDANTVVDVDYATVKATAGTALQSVPDTYSTKLEADALYAPISVDGADGDAAKVVTDAIGALTPLVDVEANDLTTPDEIKTALNAIIGKVNDIIDAA